MADNENLKEKLEQREESNEKVQTLEIMMERILALEKRDKARREDGEVEVEQEE